MDAGLKVVEILTTESSEVAFRIAQELDEHNRERQAMEARVLEEALSQVGSDPTLGERYSIVVGQEGWHTGVLGIVASRILERFHRPTVVVGFHQGEGKGSARSIRGFHMVEGLRCCADFLEKFGGHEFAGGLSIKQEKFPFFRDRFEEMARAFFSP
jgi:single-stranded-DNA-specific exonuclease